MNLDSAKKPLEGRRKQRLFSANNLPSRMFFLVRRYRIALESPNRRSF